MISLCSLALLCAATLAGAADVDENLLRNPGFEKGGRSLANWSEIYPQSLATPPPHFGATEQSPHSGDRAGSIEVEYQGGYTSLTQTVRVPKKARSVHLECRARIDRPGQSGAASMMVWFTVPGSAQGGSMAQSRRLVDATEWTRLTVDAAIPEGTTELVVRCGVLGPCSASFDDAVLTCSDVEVTAGVLAVAHGDYTARATGRQSKPWVRMSIPFPIGGQTPLAVRVTADPADAVVGLAIVEDRDNRPLEVRLGPLSAGDEVALRIETLALLRDRPLSDGRGVALRGRPKPPKDVRLHLESAPGVDAEGEQATKIAKTLPKKDLAGLMGGLRDYLRANLEYAGGEDQGSEHCLESGVAVCTGYANTAAALLIAREVPTRILACTTLGSRLQEHYIVEAWTPALGWSRMESTMATFPWGDSKNLVLRIVYPDSERSFANVPLYRDASKTVECAFRMGPDACWQGGTVLETLALPADALEHVETAARDAFDHWTGARVAGATHALLADDLDLPAECAPIAETVRAWLEEPGQLDD